jgi:hypothetical protein
VLALALLPAATAAAAPVSLEDLGDSGGSARGIEASVTTFVPLPPGYALAGGTADLRFEHSPLLLADRSTVTLLAGDVPVASARLTRANATGGRLRARLPSLPQARGGFTLTARFSMRLTRDDCEDPRNAALWARVLPSTTVDANLVPARRGLADALANLAPAAPGESVDLVLPGRPTAGQLAAAGIAAGAVGRAGARAGVDPLIELAPTAGERAALVVGDPAAGTPPGTGAVASAQEGPPRLDLSGDDRGVLLAAQALEGVRLTPQAGREALVSAAPPRVPARSAPWHEPETTFAQLGIGTREVVGQGVATIDLTIDRPPTWRITGEPKLDLRVVAGAAIRTETSTVTASVAGREIGSQRLRPSRGPQRLRFDVPAGLVDTELDGSAVRTIPVSVRFDLDADRGRCEPFDPEDARVALLDTSSLTLPHETTAQRDLSRFPGPGVGPVHVVVPDDPSPAELHAGLQAAAAVGRWSPPSAPLPRLVTAGGLGGERGKRSLVLVGDADEQVGRAIRAPDEPRMQAGEGVLVMRESPWAEGRTVVALRGADAAGLRRVSEAVTRRALVDRLVGTAMVIRVGTTPEATGGGAGQPPLELAPVQDESLWASIPIWAIPAAVVLLMLLATVAVVVRRRWMRPRPA